MADFYDGGKRVDVAGLLSEMLPSITILGSNQRDALADLLNRDVAFAVNEFVRLIKAEISHGASIHEAARLLATIGLNPERCLEREIPDQVARHEPVKFRTRGTGH